MSEALLSVRSIGVSFGGVAALEGVSLDLHEGTVHALIGPNGAGKTTLLNCISGLTQPASGDVRFGGASLVRVPAFERARRGIARTFQNPALTEDLTALQNVQLGLFGRSSSLAVADSVAWPGSLHEHALHHEAALRVLAELLPRVSADARLDALSLANRKLVDLARAWVSSPRVLLLDEPTSGLSVSEIEQVSKLLAAIRGKTTILVVAHHVEFVMGLADTVTVLDAGKVIASGPPREVRQDPGVISAYIGTDDG